MFNFLLLVLCLSIASGLHFQARMQLLLYWLSQSESEITHKYISKCQDAIIRLKNNPNINIDSMIKPSTNFKDSNP